MSYATASELRQRFGPAIFDEIYGSTTAAAVTADLEAASAEIDGSIAGRYALPVSGSRSLALLKDWALTLAEERGCCRPAGSAIAEKIKERAAQVRSYLEMIRNDTFRLPDAAENAASGAGGVAIIQCDQPIFDRRKMTGF